uniref:G-protein coupled receptors family 1 profile domain-containing protein n=1 Tax=Romanomermis culicivorax TaxID=13658 RepID=A0A915KB17_ROMCU
MNNTTNQDDIPSNWLILPTTTLAITSIIGFAINTFNTAILLRCGGRVPRRVKILTINGCFIYTVRCFYFILKSAYLTSILINGYQATAMSYFACVAEQAFYVSTGFGHYLSLFYVGIERLLVLKNKMASSSSSVKNQASNVYFYSVVASIWILGFLIHLLIVGLSFNQSRLQSGLNFCYISFLWDKSLSNTYTISCILLQLATCAIFAVIYRKSSQNFEQFAVKRIDGNLDHRFSIWSNIKVTMWQLKVMIPSILFTSTILVVALTVRSIIVFSNQASIIYSASVICLFGIDAFLYSLLLLR